MALQGGDYKKDFMPNKVGNMTVFFYRMQSNGVYEPLITFPGWMSLLGMVPVVIIAIFTIWIHITGLNNLESVSNWWKLADYMFLLWNLYTFVNLLLGNPGISPEIFRNAQKR